MTETGNEHYSVTVKLNMHITQLKRWKDKVYADIRRGSLKRGRQTTELNWTEFYWNTLAAINAEYMNNIVYGNKIRSAYIKWNNARLYTKYQ